MANGAIVFVHGTGVRIRDYQPAFRNAALKLKQHALDYELIACEWGDALGARFDGLSLPDLTRADLSDDDLQWYYLYDDPFHNLRPFTIERLSGVNDAPIPGEFARNELVWEKIKHYDPSSEFLELLRVSDLLPFWQSVWAFIIEESDVPARAYAASGEQTPDVSYELARAVVAELSNRAQLSGFCGPGHKLRDQMVDRLLVDWGESVFGLGDFLKSFLPKIGTSVGRRYRNAWSESAAFVIGDILLYQANGDKIRSFIREKILKSAAVPVYLMAHSLGGIACVDLLAMRNAPPVAGLITFGSQAPLLFELGAMRFIQETRSLPLTFPPWLNLYDRNDFLSYVAHRLFPVAVDREISSMRPFPESHGAYLAEDDTWAAIGKFLKGADQC